MSILARIQPDKPCDAWVTPGAPKAQCMECGYPNARHRQQIKIFEDGKFVRYEIPQ